MFLVTVPAPSRGKTFPRSHPAFHLRRTLVRELVLGMCTQMYEKQYLYQHYYFFFVLNPQELLKVEAVIISIIIINSFSSPIWLLE